MLVGHFAVGFIAKRAEPKLSLGTLFLAVMTAIFLVRLYARGIGKRAISPRDGSSKLFPFKGIDINESTAV